MRSANFKRPPDQASPTFAHISDVDVMIAVTVEGCNLAITASVMTHNAFGRAYMLPVAPAHRLIVWAMMRRLKRDLATEQGRDGL